MTGVPPEDMTTIIDQLNQFNRDISGEASSSTSSLSSIQNPVGGSGVMQQGSGLANESSLLVWVVNFYTFYAQSHKDVLSRMKVVEGRQQRLEEVLSRQEVINTSMKSLTYFLYVLAFFSAICFVLITVLICFIVFNNPVPEYYNLLIKIISFVGVSTITVMIYPCLRIRGQKEKLDELDRRIKIIENEINDRK